MASVNKVIILGNCGRDPETRYMPNGDAVTNLSVATAYKWKDKASGEMREETEWHRVTFFGRLAEIAKDFLEKGMPVYIEGRIKTRKYTDKQGIEKYSTDIIAESMQLLGRREPGREPGQDDEESAPPAPARAPAQRPQVSRGHPADMDSDIPL